jgi:hypothetical protein
MDSVELIRNIKAEIDALVNQYSEGAAGQTELGIKLDSLDLNPEQKRQVVDLIKQAIEESTYNLLSAFEGSASLNGSQECYTIIDEQGNEVSGKLDTVFYEQVME